MIFTHLLSPACGGGFPRCLFPRPFLGGGTGGFNLKNPLNGSSDIQNGSYSKNPGPKYPGKSVKIVGFRTYPEGHERQPQRVENGDSDSGNADYAIQGGVFCKK